MGTVRWDTDEMRDWSGNVNDNNQTYTQDVTELFQEIEGFVKADFRGGVADEFFDMYEANKQQFTSTTEVIEDAINFVNKKADTAESEEQELANSMKKNNYFNI